MEGVAGTAGVTASQSHGLLLNANGSFCAVGQNENGELGDATAVNRSTPVPAALTGTIVSLSSGWYHGLAATSDGAVRAWGRNSNGELGDGTQIAKPTPTPVPGLTGITAVAAGNNYSLALKSDGTVLAWGFNNFGQLGDGTTTTRLSPVSVINLTGVVAIAAGGQASFALKNDGTVWAWGYNGHGELGDGTTTARTSAVLVANLTGVVKIAAGASHTLALSNDGTVWAWGYNAYGALGDGSTTNRPTAVHASSLTGVVSIAAGDNHSLAAKSDGTVWAWGFNSSGQLGNGSTTQSVTPTQVTAMPSPALAVAAGAAHSLALLRSGYVYSWGDNAQGQFGTGDTTDSTIPVRGPFVGAIYSLTTNARGGTVLANPPSSDGNYTDGRRVCLSSVPEIGQLFTGWSGNTLDVSNCLTMSADSAITANFAATPPLRFIPVTPCRVADTRLAQGSLGGPAIAGQASRDFPILQSTCGIPNTALAYSFNITVVPSGLLQFLTAWPTGSVRPNSSVLNSDGRVKASAAIFPAGTNGAVSVFVTETTHVILDINGYFVPASDSNALAFYPIQPCRVADTRGATGPLGGPSLPAGSSRTFPMLMSSCGLPANAQAYALNFTALPKGSLGYLSVWPAGQAQPGASTLNASTGAITANTAIVQAGSAGDISAIASDETGLIIDVNGYFAAPGNGGLSLYNVPPCRIFDTRAIGSSQPFTGTIGVNAALGASCNVPTGAQALALNATVVPAGGLGYLSLWPFGQNQPGVSTLNANDGAVTSNLALAPDAAGAINAFASDRTHLILDVSSYFAPIIQ